MNGPSELEARRALRPLDRIVTQAVNELWSARHAMHEARRKLLAKDLSPLARGNLEGIHDRAAKRVTAATFALNQALDAAVDG